MKKAAGLLFFTIVLITAFGCNRKPVKTIENLKVAYKGESTASVKYAAFAEKAKTDGFDTVAIMFMAASKSEYIHASNHRNALISLGEKADGAAIDTFKVLSTKENLANAIKGEAYESEVMYPRFIGIAEKERCAYGIMTFTRAYSTEKKHRVFFTTALSSIAGGEEKNLPSQWFVCPVCGNTYDNTFVTAACELCKTTPDNFIVFSL